jgi:hypothetical protein
LVTPRGRGHLGLKLDEAPQGALFSRGEGGT